MGNLKIQAEILQLSSYCEILKKLLLDHKELTIVKTLVYAYLIKKNNCEHFDIYKGNTRNDVTYKSLSLLAGDKTFFSEVVFILKAIDLLVKNTALKMEGETLFINVSNNAENIRNVDVNLFLQTAINDSRKLTDKQFMKEVITSV